MPKDDTTIVMPWNKGEEARAVPQQDKAAVQIMKCRRGKAQSGDPKIQVRGIVLSPKPLKGRNIFVSYTLDPWMIEEFRKLVEAALPGVKLPRKQAEFKLSRLDGKKIRCGIGVRTTEQGGKFNNLVNPQPVDGAAAAVDDEDEDEHSLEDELGDEDDGEDDESEVDEDELREELEGMRLKELKARVEEKDLESLFESKKWKKADTNAKRKRLMIEALVEAATEGDEEDNEDIDLDDDE